MTNKPPPFNCLKNEIPIILPIKGRGFINHRSVLPLVWVPNSIIATQPGRAGRFVGSRQAGRAGRVPYPFQICCVHWRWTTGNNFSLMRSHRSKLHLHTTSWALSQPRTRGTHSEFCEHGWQQLRQGRSQEER